VTNLQRLVLELKVSDQVEGACLILQVELGVFVMMTFQGTGVWVVEALMVLQEAAEFRLCVEPVHQSGGNCCSFGRGLVAAVEVNRG